MSEADGCANGMRICTWRQNVNNNETASYFRFQSHYCIVIWATGTCASPLTCTCDGKSTRRSTGCSWNSIPIPFFGTHSSSVFLFMDQKPGWKIHANARTRFPFTILSLCFLLVAVRTVASFMWVCLALNKNSPKCLLKRIETRYQLKRICARIELLLFFFDNMKLVTFLRKYQVLFYKKKLNVPS